LATAAFAAGGGIKVINMDTIALKSQAPGELIPPETIQAIARAIAERFSPEQIILLGSYASGQATPDSDLDLVIVMETELPSYERAVSIRLLFRPSPCAMDLFVYTPAEMEEWNGTVNHILTEAFQHGKPLYERAPC
jgi:predicted nucleotidyltransferase